MEEPEKCLSVLSSLSLHQYITWGFHECRIHNLLHAPEFFAFDFIAVIWGHFHHESTENLYKAASGVDFGKLHKHLG